MNFFGSDLMKVKFIDSDREPKCKPNPRFPDGQHIDISQQSEQTCEAKIPYPAPRCGLMVVECEVCGFTVALTVAGRPDDPHTVKLPCKLRKGVH
jgi:hypothetical protein